jgi:hypothetical protein
MNEHEQNRLWMHRLHEDIILNERQNFFLVAESVFAVAFTEALTSTEPMTFIAVLIACIGFVLTLAWLLVNRRQYRNVQQIQRRAVAFLPEFRATYLDREEDIVVPEGFRRHVTLLVTNPLAYPSTRILVYIVPTLVAAMWLLFLGWIAV